MSMHIFGMTEKELSISIGLSRETIKVLRSSYTENVHWVRIASKKPEHLWSIDWTDQGVDALRLNLGIGPKEEQSSVPNKEGKVKGKYKNPRIMCITINGKDYNVLCKDSSKFVIGMNVDVKWDGVRWCVARHPRFNGKY